MNNLKKMTLSNQETYNLSADCEMVMENLKQHIVEYVGNRFPQVLDDLVNNYESLIPMIKSLADDFDDPSIPFATHALCLAGMCIRIAAYYCAKD